MHYLISDLHIGHRNIIKHCRPQFTDLRDMHNYMIHQWNSVVKKGDTVTVLGDVILDRSHDYVLSYLNGTKNLILGNHDKFQMSFYMKYFNKILSSRNLKGCLLTHIPVHEGQKYRYKLNIHGHMHQYKLEDPFYRNVSVEQLDFKPISLEEILDGSRESAEVN